MDSRVLILLRGLGKAAGGYAIIVVVWSATIGAFLASLGWLLARYPGWWWPIVAGYVLAGWAGVKAFQRFA